MGASYRCIRFTSQVSHRLPILFGKYSGSEIKLDGTEYMIMREDEVLGILSANGTNGTAKKK